jgi:hypothetical protein
MESYNIKEGRIVSNDPALVKAFLVAHGYLSTEARHYSKNLNLSQIKPLLEFNLSLPKEGLDG